MREVERDKVRVSERMRERKRFWGGGEVNVSGRVGLGLNGSRAWASRSGLGPGFWAESWTQ